MASFIVAILLLFLTPGPGVLSIAGVGSAFGYGPGFRYMVGLFIGTNIVALAVVTGLATILLADPTIRTVLLWASGAYLVYLALRIALAGSKIAFSAVTKQPGISDGIALQILNPKAYVVNTTLFTGFPLFEDAFGAEIAVKFLIVNVAWIGVHTIWLWAGVSLHRLELKPNTQSAINIAMALAMLIVVALAAQRTV